MKKWMIIVLLVLAVVAASSVSYAWFTYVQRKSLVKLTSHEIEANLYLDDESLTTSLDLTGISYISFEDEVMQSIISDGFNETGLNYIFRINVSELSPLMKVFIQMTHEHPELVILWIDEGLEDEHTSYVTDYLSYLKTIGEGSLNKAEFLTKINLHNEAVLEGLKQMELKPGSSYLLQLVLWVDYDALGDPTNYLSNIYQLSFDISMVSGKSDFND
jgi:hypothetical protein